MAHASEYDCYVHEEKKIRQATNGLLDLLNEHHDYSIPKPAITRAEVITIQSQPEEGIPIDICILPVHEGRLTVNAIKRVVCKYFNVSHTEMVSPRRDRQVQRPRMVAMYLAREFTTHGFPTLGKYFRRDHTSVLAAVNRADQLIADGDPISRHIEILRGVLSA